MAAARSDDGEVEILEGRPSFTSQLKQSWAVLPLLWRSVVAAAILLTVGPALTFLVVTQAQHWASERSLSAEAALTATIDVSSSSTSSDGGRIDYYVTVRNTGTRLVRISGLEVTNAQLRIRSENFLAAELAPGETVEVPVSVRLDCVGGSAVEGKDSLPATIAATPGNGHPRNVNTPLDQSALLTDVIDTVCRLRPGLRDKELSGPVG